MGSPQHCVSSGILWIFCNRYGFSSTSSLSGSIRRFWPLRHSCRRYVESNPRATTSGECQSEAKTGDKLLFAPFPILALEWMGFERRQKNIRYVFICYWQMHLSRLQCTIYIYQYVLGNLFQKWKNAGYGSEAQILERKSDWSSEESKPFFVVRYA